MAPEKKNLWLWMRQAKHRERMRIPPRKQRKGYKGGEEKRMKEKSRDSERNLRRAHEDEVLLLSSWLESRGGSIAAAGEAREQAPQRWNRRRHSPFIKTPRGNLVISYKQELLHPSPLKSSKFTLRG